MPRRSRVDLSAVDQAALVQDGLVTARQLRSAGVASSTVSKRMRTGGPWSRVLPGVYLVAGGSPNLQQRRRAALLFGGASAVLSGIDALELHGVQRAEAAPAPAHLILLPHDIRRTSAGFAAVERTRRPPAPLERAGLRIAPVPRAVVDAARRMLRRSDVVALAARAVQGGFATVDQLSDEVERAQIRGTALIREAVRDLAGGARSAPEAELRRHWLASDLPAALWNVDLCHPDGTFIARPDVYLPDSGVAVEVDSREHHLSPADWERTMRRHGSMSAHGVVVLHYPPSQIRRAPDDVLKEIAATVHARVGAPVPNVVVMRGGIARSR